MATGPAYTEIPTCLLQDQTDIVVGLISPQAVISDHGHDHVEQRLTFVSASGGKIGLNVGNILRMTGR